MESDGEGALKQAFEALKFKLNNEGLFDTARKRSLPEKNTSNWCHYVV
jgi:exodeoxyribonuclease VII large subunit